MEKNPGDSILLLRRDFIRKSSKILTSYNITAKPIANGSYGSVHICTHILTHEKRAVRIIPRYKLKNAASFLNEIEILKLVDHPHIIRMYEWFEDPQNIYIVTDLCEGGELFGKIIDVKHFTEQVAAKLFYDMMHAVNYCNEKKICHKDLKPENFMFSIKDDLRSIKLIDFGFAEIFEDPSKLLYNIEIGRITMKARVGTAYYIAPEIIQGKYDEKCDVWSMGVILYVLICGAPPFYGRNDREVLESVKRGKYKFDRIFNNYISSNLG